MINEIPAGFGVGLRDMIVKVRQFALRPLSLAAVATVLGLVNVGCTSTMPIVGRMQGPIDREGNRAQEQAPRPPIVASPADIKLYYSDQDPPDGFELVLAPGGMRAKVKAGFKHEILGTAIAGGECTRTADFCEFEANAAEKAWVVLRNLAHEAGGNAIIYAQLTRPASQLQKVSYRSQYTGFAHAATGIVVVVAP